LADRAAPEAPLPRSFAPAFFAAVFDTGAAARDRPPLAALADGLGILAAPAAFLRRVVVVEDLPDFLDQVFWKARLGHERVAAGSLRALRDAGQRVTGQRDDGNCGGAVVGLEAPCRFPSIHHRQR